LYKLVINSYRSSFTPYRSSFIYLL